MSFIEGFWEFLKNTTLNSLGAKRDLFQLIEDKDISQAKELFLDHSEEVKSALKEYNPETHAVMKRQNKYRKGKEPYVVQKLPRSWQRYINEVALFFLLAKPIRWTCTNLDDTNKDAFDAFDDFLNQTLFNPRMRQAKRMAGAETESAKLYHVARNDETNEPEVRVVILSKSEGYSIRPLFDQYKRLMAIGIGYYLKETTNTVEHFDIYTDKAIYRCSKNKIGWGVYLVENKIGKIPVIYYKQPKEWEGSDQRIARDEMLDSKSADTNEYFADPVAKVSADVIDNMVDPEQVGKLIQMQGKDSVFEYVEPPQSVEMKESEKKVLRQSILDDTFTPDFSYENMKGTGTLSGEALKRAMILGYIKRDNRKEIYDELVIREKNLILAIMANVTHIGMRDSLLKLQIEHEFAEPFDEDMNTRWSAIGTAYSDGIISLETAVMLMGVADPTEEIERIKAEADEEAKRNNLIGLNLQ